MITIMFNIQVKGGMGLTERKGTSAKSTKKEIGPQEFNPSKWGKNVLFDLNYSGQLLRQPYSNYCLGFSSECEIKLGNGHPDFHFIFISFLYFPVIH
jgi:hypothetical protein